MEGDELNIGRIFVSPEHFRKGYGIFLMQAIEKLFPDVREFTLDTPVWNVWTNAFYAKKEQDFLERKRRRGLENVICFGLRRYAA